MAGRFGQPRRQYAREPKNDEPVAVGKYGKIPRDAFKAITRRGCIAAKAVNLRTQAMDSLGYQREQTEFIIHTYHTFVSVKIAPDGMVFVSATRDGKLLDEKHRFTIGPELEAGLPSLPTPVQFDNCEAGKMAGLPELGVEANVKAWLAEFQPDAVNAAASAELSAKEAELARMSAELDAKMKAFQAMMSGVAPAVAPAAVPAVPPAQPLVTAEIKAPEAPQGVDDPFLKAVDGKPAEPGMPSAKDFSSFAGAL
jgi:hypothetical protein